MSETIILHSAGSVPGIPGEYAPGTYTVDYVARTLTPVVAPESTLPPDEHPPLQGLELAAEVARLEQEVQVLVNETTSQVQ